MHYNHPDDDKITYYQSGQVNQNTQQVPPTDKKVINPIKSTNYKTLGLIFIVTTIIFGLTLGIKVTIGAAIVLYAVQYWHNHN